MVPDTHRKSETRATAERLRRISVVAGAGVALGVLIMAGPAGPCRADSIPVAETDDPEGHFFVAKAAELGKDEAEIAYASLLDLMTRAYVASAEPSARRYLGWARVNDAPYRSVTHGNRYVNNYANPAAAAAGYGRAGAEMPAGAVIAKDSFTATAGGRRYPGALFLMEKLKPEASPETADWRYLMIMPDGSTFGDSRANGPRMAFCHSCHAARADDDYLFFVPAEYAKAP
jgi:hypothetical protein